MTESTRRRKGQERERKVIDAAAEVLAERGMANVRIADVAERAGMTPGHVTYYFPSKNDMLMRAIRDSEERFIDDLERRLEAIADPWERLRTYIAAATALAPGDPGWVLWLDVWATAANDAEIAAVHEELDGASRQLLTGIIEYGVARGDFTAVDPAATSMVLAAVIDGLSIHLTLSAGVRDRERLLDLCEVAARAQLGGMP